MIKGYNILGIKMLNPNHYAKIIIKEKLTFWQMVKKWFARWSRWIER